MDNITSDFSLPPQWVLNLYKPDEIPPHVLVTVGEEPDTYIIQEVDFHAVNLYTIPLSFNPDFPVKGEPKVFVGSIEELYAELREMDEADKVITTGAVRKALSANNQIPLAFGMASDFSTPSMVFSDYKQFLNAEKAYKEHPEQVGLAYDFINTHPMFWGVITGKRDKVRVVTGRGWQRLDFEIFNKTTENGLETTVTIETGPHNYHDYNLDVYAPSFDAAVIELARLIHKHYDSHGGFTDKTKKEPNDNFFREADKEMEAEEASK